MTHGWNGFREVESASYDGRVIQCLCGENFVDAVDYGKHLAATGASTPGFEGRYDTEQPLQGHLLRLYQLRQACRWCGSDAHQTDEHFLDRDEIDFSGTAEPSPKTAAVPAGQGSRGATWQS